MAIQLLSILKDLLMAKHLKVEKLKTIHLKLVLDSFIPGFEEQLVGISYWRIKRRRSNIP